MNFGTRCHENHRVRIVREVKFYPAYKYRLLKNKKNNPLYVFKESGFNGVFLDLPGAKRIHISLGL